MVTSRQRSGSNSRLFVSGIEEDLVDGRALKRARGERQRDDLVLGQNELRVAVHAKKRPRSAIAGRVERPEKGIDFGLATVRQSGNDNDRKIRLKVVR